MKEDFFIVAGVFFLVISIMFSVYSFNLSGSMTGLVTSEEDINDSIEEIVDEQSALDEMDQARQIISSLEEEGFAVTYMEDLMMEAEKVLEQVRYAEVLRDPNSTAAQKQEANRVLQLINWADVDYNDVLAYTDEVKEREEKIYLLQDKIIVEEESLKEWDDVPQELVDLLEEVKISFEEERLNEAETLLNEFENSFEEYLDEQTRLNSLAHGALNFFKKNWLFLLIFFGLIVVVLFFSMKRLRKNLLVKKIEKMQVEKRALVGLMKRAQNERFNENKIPGLIYKIRMKKYQEKLERIKEELPVVEERLRKLGNR